MKHLVSIFVSLTLLTGCAHVSTYTNVDDLGVSSNEIHVDPSLANRIEYFESMGSVMGTHHIGTLLKTVFTGDHNANYTLSYVRSNLTVSYNARHVQYALTTKISDGTDSEYLSITAVAPLKGMDISYGWATDDALKEATILTYYEAVDFIAENRASPNHNPAKKD